METKSSIAPIPKTREHISVIVEKLWAVILFFGAYILGNQEMLSDVIRLMSKGKIWQALAIMGGALLIFLIIFGFCTLRWYKTSFVVEDFTITITRNTLNQEVRSIAVANISNVNVEQNLFEMVMGTCKLKLDTSSLSTANETDVQLVLKKSDAAKVKDTISAMMREQKQMLAGEQSDAPESAAEGANAKTEENVSATASYVDEFDFMTAQNEDYDILYTPKQVIRNCAMNTSIFSVLFAIALTLVPIITAFADGGIAVITGATLGTILVEAVFAISIVSSIVKTWFADFDFRAKRGKDRIYVSCGLFKKRQYAVPIDKINAVKLDTKMLGRLFGYARVSVINVGGEDEDVDGMRILLAGKEEELRANLQTLLPEYVFPDMNNMHLQPKRVLVKSVVTTVVTFALFIIGFLVGLHVAAGSDASKIQSLKLLISLGIAALGVFWLVGVFFSYRVSKIGQTKEYFIISTGVFGREVVTIPYDKIQYVTIHQGPLERLFKVSHANISILASMLSMHQVTKYFDTDEFEGLLEEVRGHYIRL